MTPERIRQVRPLLWFVVYLVAMVTAALLLVPNPRPVLLAGLVFAPGAWGHGYICGRSRSR